MAGFKREKKEYNFSSEKSSLTRYVSAYEYSPLELEEEDKVKLINLEQNIKTHGEKIGESAYRIGESLETARGVFKKYSTEENDPSSFVTWYSSLGLNKDQVYLFRGRYNLALNYPNHLDKIISLSDRAIKETIHSKTPDELKEKVINGEITTGKAIAQERTILVKSQISSMLEKESDEILEAEIVETNSEKIKKISEEIMYLERDIKERESNLKKLFLKKEALIEEKAALEAMKG